VGDPRAVWCRRLNVDAKLLFVSNVGDGVLSPDGRRSIATQASCPIFPSPLIGPKGAILAGLLMAAGLALWWNYGLLVVLAGPTWLCLPR
jgi:hypothetical protein